MGSTGDRQTKPRWTADTEIAFLLALRMHGTAKAACREIGRPFSSVAFRRKRKPDFAARWQAVLDAKPWATIAAEKAKLAAIDPVDLEPDTGEMCNRARVDGWTPLRQRAFLRALTATGEIETACKLARISNTAVRKARAAYPSFAAACERAIAKAEPTLEQIAVDRAINGVAEPVYHAGQVVGHKRRYSDALMRDALKREDARMGTHKSKRDLVEEAKAAARLAGGFFSLPADDEAVNASLLKKLDGMRRRTLREERLRAERLLADGLVP
ncbi:hypothetical protein [Sphingomonas sp. HMP6]|uniref:hypothetical protein n=1 Tax=Sphingomonas sp. HMP6 TaxID=1517551 RepID=UPI00159677DA|nr:hypothetical protein [Sphingomonas sp. HMP6]BCA58618.1 hypothetical protein HMP06_1387 [Sphingomonas sp. HMP6]